MKYRFVDAKGFKTAIREDATAPLILRKHFIAEVEKGSGDDGSIHTFAISTEAVDRDKDSVALSGWDTDSWKSNPVVLFAHDSSQPPVAKGTKIWKHDKKLKASAEFTSRDLYPFGHMIGRMYSEGFMKAVSVGFLPKEYEWVDEEKEPDRVFGIDFKKQELLEFSTVPVPANPEALLLAHSKGIDTAPLKEWAEKVLDAEEKLRGLTATEVEKAWEVVNGLLGTRVVVFDQFKGDQAGGNSGKSTNKNPGNSRDSGSELLEKFLALNDWEARAKLAISESCKHEKTVYAKTDTGLEEQCSDCAVVLEKWAKPAPEKKEDPPQEPESSDEMNFDNLSKDDIREIVTEVAGEELARQFGRLPS